MLQNRFSGASLSRVVLFVLSLLLTITGNSHALTRDRDKPITVEADSAEIDEARGLSTYKGHVQVRQGSLNITASTITVSKKDAGNRIVAVGIPARFRQRPDGEQEDVVATARRVEYETDSDKLLLTGQAQIEQSGNVFRSDRIVYDMKKNRVEAGSGKQGPATPKQRVHITIQPQSDTKKEVRTPE